MRTGLSLEKEIDCLEDLRVEGSIFLKWILVK
jgi:hypothetical protein